MSQLNQCLAMALQLQVAFLLLEKANQKTTKKNYKNNFYFFSKKLKKIHVQ
jgi:homoserine trans-succinylase